MPVETPTQPATDLTEMIPLPEEQIVIEHLPNLPKPEEKSEDIGVGLG